MEINDAKNQLMQGKNIEIITLIEPSGRKEGLKFSYDVMAATPENLDGLSGAWRTLGKEDADFSEQKDAIVDALLGLGFSWGDAEGKHRLLDNGDPVLADREGLRRTPTVILNAALDAIFNERRPNEPSQPS